MTSKKPVVEARPMSNPLDRLLGNPQNVAALSLGGSAAGGQQPQQQRVSPQQQYAAAQQRAYPWQQALAAAPVAYAWSTTQPQAMAALPPQPQP
jgi:hypothetical protein